MPEKHIEPFFVDIGAFTTAAAVVTTTEELPDAQEKSAFADERRRFLGKLKRNEGPLPRCCLGNGRSAADGNSAGWHELIGADLHSGIICASA